MLSLQVPHTAQEHHLPPSILLRRRQRLQTTDNLTKLAHLAETGRINAYRGRRRGLGRRSGLQVGKGTPPRRTRGAALRSAGHLDVAGQLILARIGTPQRISANNVKI